MVPVGMPGSVQAGGAAAAVPPAAAFRKGARVLRDVPEDARVAAVVVSVGGAEAEAVLVDAVVGAPDSVP